VEKPELWKSWKITIAHLEHARKNLPEPAEENRSDYQHLLSDYHSYLEHNELELALDMLAELGDLARSKGGFWRELERAAKTMGLDEKASRLHGKYLETLRALRK
jgi:hypothetical protein